MKSMKSLACRSCGATLQGTNSILLEVARDKGWQIDDEGNGRCKKCALLDEAPVESISPLSDIELDVLEALAKEATPGPWVSEEAFGGKHDRWAFIVKREGTEVSFDLGIAEMVGEERHEENAAYIAAVNPVVILSLIAEARRHRRCNHE